MESNLETAFLYFWRALAPSYPEPTIQHRFAPPRRWRFDFAWLDQAVAVEVEGGIYTNGRHTRGAGYEKDVEKYNAAVVRGWRVYRVTASMLQNDPASLIEDIIKLLEAR